MSRLTHHHFRLVAASAAAALAIGVVAGPAIAAGEETAAISYTCVTALGDATPTATYAINQPPASLVAGQVAKLPATASFTLDKTTTGLAAGLGWKSMDGAITTTPAASGAGLKLAIARTVLGNNPDGSTTAVASGKTLVRAFKAGTYTAKLGALGTVALMGYDASNASLGEVDFPNDDGTIKQCKNNAGSTPLTDASGTAATVKVSKDKTTTAVKAAYSSAKHLAKGTAKVKSHFGLKPTGTVKFVLKKGTKTVATIKSKVNKLGVAKAGFKNIKKHGVYKIRGSYLGNKALKPSSGTAKFTA